MQEPSIRYDLFKHREFLDSLDKALRSVFIDRYDDLYKKAIKLFEEFRQQTKSKAKRASKEVFSDYESALREFLLPRIVADKDEIEIIKDMAVWYENEITAGGTAHDGAEQLIYFCFM